MTDGNLKKVNNVIMGEGVWISDFVNLYGCKLGANTKVGPFVEIQKDVTIGNNCKVSSHSFICEGVRIGNGVFIGHGVFFTNDKYPRAVNEDGSIKKAGEWTMVETVVEDGASIGTGSTILCGIKIGRGSIVGAGSVVTKDVPPDTVVVGNPAHFLKMVGE